MSSTCLGAGEDSRLLPILIGATAKHLPPDGEVTWDLKADVRPELGKNFWLGLDMRLPIEDTGEVMCFVEGFAGIALLVTVLLVALVFFSAVLHFVMVWEGDLMNLDAI